MMMNFKIFHFKMKIFSEIQKWHIKKFKKNYFDIYIIINIIFLVIYLKKKKKKNNK
jgi:hypothetical protein